MIGIVDVSALFDAAAADSSVAEVDAALAGCASGLGFLSLVGLPERFTFTDRRVDNLAKIFALPAERLHELSRARYRDGSPNIYRGYFPPEAGKLAYKCGIDMGGELVDDTAPWPEPRGGDPLREATRVPPEAELPGWRDEARATYAAMTELGLALLRSLVRGLGGDADAAAAHFRDGVSTMRLLQYPVRDAAHVEALGADAFVGDRVLSCDEHVDSGFITLLHQDSTGGLQVRRPADGEWLDVPPRPGSLVLNFGLLFERWSGGRVRATRHRVLAVHPPRERRSFPFFFEPSPDAQLTPLFGGDDFTIVYGQHVWAEMCKFVEFRGMERLRDESMRRSSG